MANRDKQGDFEGVSGVENIKALAEKARELAATRVSAGAADSASAAARARDGGVVLMPETKDLYVEAQKVLDGAMAQEFDHTLRKLEDDQKTKLVFIKCRANHLPNAEGRAQPQHGVYLTKNPGDGEVKADEWFATYKKQGDTKYRGDVICQVCLEHGINNPLPIVWLDPRAGTFRVEPRWLWWRDKASGRETRANLTSLAAQNSWAEGLELTAKVG